MSNAHYVGQNARSFNVSPEFEGYSKVVIVVTDELEYSAGTDTGRTLTLTCPWGTQDMANNILKDIKGYKYHPYNATGAFLDPSAEIGDGVTVNGIYSGIYTMDVTFGGDCRADISAPMEEEIDHEYPYVPKQERTITRKFAQVESEFEVQAGKISAKVSKTGGNNDSFGWELDEKSWTLKSKGKDVLKAYEGGVTITGKIFAEEGGRIGGFDIMSNYLSYNKQTWDGTNSTGIYVGTQGIQCGPADHGVQITNTGYLYAEHGEFRGTVRAGNILFDNPNEPGKGYGTISGLAITQSTIPKAQLVNSVRTSLGYADTANSVFQGNERAKFIKADTLSGHVIKMGGKTNEQVTLGYTQISYTKGNGTVGTLNVVTWS